MRESRLNKLIWVPAFAGTTTQHMFIDCKKISEQILSDLKQLPVPKKYFAGVLVGDNPASKSFLKIKEDTAKKLGVDFRLYKFPAEIKNDDLRKEVLKISQHKTCGGVIVQLPLPEHLNKYYVLNAIPREKDVDVIGERALGAFYNGRNSVLPPAVGVVQLLTTNYSLQTTSAAIVGPGFLIGKPAAIWLMGQVKELLIIDKGGDLNNLKNSDLVILGAGVAGLVKPEMLKDNATVIDFGYSLDKNGKLKGDFDMSNIENCKLKIENLSYTPTPSGTGPILVAKIFENFYRLNAEE